MASQSKAIETQKRSTLAATNALQKNRNGPKLVPPRTAAHKPSLAFLWCGGVLTEAGAAADPEGHPEAVQEALDLGQQAVYLQTEQLRLGALVPAVLVVEGPGTRCVALHKGLLLQEGLRPGRGKGPHPTAQVQGQDLHPGGKAQPILSSSSRGNRICYRAGFHEKNNTRVSTEICFFQIPFPNFSRIFRSNPPTTTKKCIANCQANCVAHV